MEFDQIKQVVNDSLKDLFDNDFPLLRHDVSERAITHKLAEYIQKRITELNVDCEYNRNVEQGDLAKKKLKFLKELRDVKITTELKNSKDEEDFLAVSTYPDIIVHRRAKNDENLLVIEVKKTNSKVGSDFDHQKLKAFTEKNGPNTYNYKYGVYILLDTGSEKLKEPELIWFIEEKETK